MNHPWLGMVYPIKMVIWRLVYYGFTMFYPHSWSVEMPIPSRLRGPTAEHWAPKLGRIEKTHQKRCERWGMSDDGCGFKNLLWSFMIFYDLLCVFFPETRRHRYAHTHTRRNIGFSQQFSPPKPQEWNSKFAGITQSFWGINQAQPLGDCLKIRHPNSYKILICLFNRIEVSPMFRQTQIHLSEVKYG